MTHTQSWSWFALHYAYRHADMQSLPSTQAFKATITEFIKSSYHKDTYVQGPEPLGIDGGNNSIIMHTGVTPHPILV